MNQGPGGDPTPDAGGEQPPSPPPAPTAWGAPQPPAATGWGPAQPPAPSDQGQGGVGGRQDQDPGAQGRPPSTPAPRYGQYGPQGGPQYGQHGPQGPPQYGQYGQYSQYSQPYGRPMAPRPGIIPLRPLSLGELLDGAFRAIRTNPRVMFGLSAVVVTFTALVQLAVTWSIFSDLESLVLATTATTTAELEALDAALTDLFSQLAVALGAQTISAIVTTILSGLLIVSVSQSVLGNKASVSEVWATAKGQIWRLLGLSLLVTLIVVSPIVPWLLVTIGAATQEQWGLAAAVGILGGLAALAAVLFLVAKTALATPALMLERSGVVAGLRRGWALTTGTFWRVLGIYLLTALIVSFVSGAINGSVSIVAQVAAPDPTTAVFTPTYLILTTLAQIAAAALTTPFTAAVIALLYIDVRMRREGLDLELARAAGEQR